MSARVVRIRLRGWILITALLFGVPALAQGRSEGARLLLIGVHRHQVHAHR